MVFKGFPGALLVLHHKHMSIARRQEIQNVILISKLEH
jgi:hypothetical protein